MAEYFAGGHLRFVNGEWRDDSGNAIEISCVRHGLWEKRGQEIYCSECGEESGYTWAGASRYSDYCPNCGAKMEQED